MPAVSVSWAAVIGSVNLVGGTVETSSPPRLQPEVLNQVWAGLRSLWRLQGRVLPASPAPGGPSDRCRSWACGCITSTSVSVVTRSPLWVSASKAPSSYKDTSHIGLGPT